MLKACIDVVRRMENKHFLCELQSLALWSKPQLNTLFYENDKQTFQHPS